MEDLIEFVEYSNPENAQHEDEGAVIAQFANAQLGGGIYV